MRWGGGARRRSGHKRALGASAAVLLVVPLLGGCARTQIVASHKFHFWVQVPPGWALFNEVQSEHAGFLVGVQPPAYLAVFSDNRQPQPTDVDTASAHPWGVVVVQTLSHSTGATLSLESLRDMLFDVDQMSQDGELVQALSPPETFTDGTIRGLEQSFSIPGAQAKTEDYVIKSFINAASTTSWTLAVGCSPSCFQSDQFQINRLMGSFTVEDKG